LIVLDGERFVALRSGPAVKALLAERDARCPVGARR
jgi:hypothetical protein